MGGFMAGVAGALGDRLHEHQLLQLQQAVSGKQNLLDAYKGLLSDDNLRDVHGDIAQTMINAAGTDPQKLFKTISKPGSEFDPSRWAMMAQMRRAGQMPSPANDGTKPVQVPPGAMGQPNAGQPGPTLPPWQQSLNAQTSMEAPPAPTSNGTGAAGGAVGTPPPMLAAQPPGQQPNPSSPAPASSSAPGAGQTGAGQNGQVSVPGAEKNGNIAAQALQALPPTAGNPAPQGAEVASPAQATATAAPSASQPLMQIPPPPAPEYGPIGNLLPESKFRQDLAHVVAEARTKSGTDIDIAQAKLKVIEPYLQSVDPRIANVIRMETLQGGNGAMGASALMNTLFAAPQQRRYQRPDGTLGIEYVDRFGNVVGDNQGYAGARITGYTPDGRPVYEDTTGILKGGGQGSAQTAGGAPIAGQSQAAPKTITNPDGTTSFTSAAGAARGAPPVPTGGVNPAMLGSQTSGTTDASGNIRSIRTKVPPAPAGTGNQTAISPPPPISNGTEGGSSNVRPEIRRYAEDLRDGKNPTIPVKDRDAVTKYMVANNISSPTPLSARGEADLAAIDPILAQINDLTEKLRSEGIHNNNNPTALVKDYGLYRLGVNNPHSDLFTNLSFEQMRSAAAAMKGTNSRAYQILNRALQHTPTLDRAGGLDPDSPKAIYGKLNEMRTILMQGKNSILADEKKSGIPGVADNGIAAPPAAADDVVQRLIQKHKDQ